MELDKAQIVEHLVYPNKEGTLAPAEKPVVENAAYTSGSLEQGSALYERHVASNKHRGLNHRHIQLIAISGSIGSSLFISIGRPLSESGPLGLLLGICLWATVIGAIANCMIEITTLLPVDGGFISMTSRFLDEAVAMGLGWNFVITQCALVCNDITAINLVVQFWAPDLHPAICISVALVLLGLINLWSVKFFGEVEFWISITKVLLMLGLFMFTLVTMCGGNPQGNAYGFQFWNNPGLFKDSGSTGHAKDIWASLSWATFGIAGPDYLSMISGEAKHPRRTLPRAFNTTMVRIAFFYIIGGLCTGIVVPFNDPRLLDRSGSSAAQSPYVIAMDRMGISGLPHLVNAVILLSIFSTTNAFLFSGSRAIYGLAKIGHAPRIFKTVNRNGVPYVSVILVMLLACLSYLSVSEGSGRILNWWINLVSCSMLIQWSIIALTYLRFRAGLKAHGLLHTGFLPRRGWLQPWSGWYAMIWCPFALVFSGYYLFPEGAFNGPDFIFAYGSCFIFLALFFVWKARLFIQGQRQWGWIPTAKMDFETMTAYFDELTHAYEYKRALKKGRGSWRTNLSEMLF